MPTCLISCLSLVGGTHKTSSTCLAGCRQVPRKRTLAAGAALFGSSFLGAVRYMFGTWLPSWSQMLRSPVSKGGRGAYEWQLLAGLLPSKRRLMCFDCQLLPVVMTFMV